MKKLLLISAVLLSFALIPSSESKKEVLLRGIIITSDWYVPNGKLEFSINCHGSSIKSLILTGKVLVFPQHTIVTVSDINKNSLTPISLSESLDKMVSINIDPYFSHYGGLIYVDITLADGTTDHHTLLILKRGNKFGIYQERKNRFVLIDSVKIKLNTNNDIQEYEIN
tara:strand:- start:504 stop:1010 length:507 start_codon:yes stop_codon:yes gene_type:complete